MINFPREFLWGAATSAYQVEGNNSNSDWWPWEEKTGKTRSAEACRHYELFREDFDLARSLNHNAHRLSVEWSRIEPQEGKFSEQEIKHYIEVIKALKERNLEPVVTLHHFTNPIWFQDFGGWLNKRSPECFLRYVKKIVEALGPDVHFWVTINEPTVYIYESYLLGVWPPQKKSVLCAKKVFDNLAKAHIKAYKLINDIYKEKNLAKPAISIAAHLQAFEYCRPTLRNKLSLYLRNKIFNSAFLERIARYKTLDFIGVNYYSRCLIDVRSPGIDKLFSQTCQNSCLPLKKNSMGWDIYPQGLYKLLLQLKRYNLPVFILENGICTDDDNQRWDFIYEHLRQISQAIRDGVNVIGYTYWALIDNFEWDKGFDPRFGLIEVDYRSFKRTVRESAKKFAKVCKTGVLE